MHPSVLAVVVPPIFGFWVLVTSLPAADEAQASQQTADEDEKAGRVIQSSDKAVVKEIVYCLEEENRHLYLTSQSLDGVDRKVERAQLKFTIPEGARVTELSLAKLDGKNLMAVVKISRGNEFDFHCLTFIAPPGGHVREHNGFHQAKFYTTQRSLNILAVGGKHHAGSVFIVLGEMGIDEQDGESWKTEGVFYFSGCPWPPSDGTLSHFRVLEGPRKAATD